MHFSDLNGFNVYQNMQDYSDCEDYCTYKVTYPNQNVSKSIELPSGEKLMYTEE